MMIARKCAWCGKQMYFRQGNEIRKFCSPQCFRRHREKLFAKEDDGPPMPPLDADKITDEGYVALVKAMVGRASQDVTKYAPGTQIRVSAEKFFQSDFFGALTGLDGEPILRKLQEEYKRKHRNKKSAAYVTRRVRCVETTTVYDSIKEAAEIYGIAPKTLYCVCHGELETAAGMHWEYV